MAAVVAAKAVEKEPAPHVVHTLAAEPVLYEPAAQFWQVALLEAKEAVEYRPAAHPEHVLHTVQLPVAKGRPNTCTSAMLMKGTGSVEYLFG